MGKYIFSEIKRALSGKLAKGYLIGIFALCILANLAVVAFRIIYGSNEGTYAYNVISYATWCFIIPYYTCIMFADMVFGKEYPDPHIRDSFTSKLSRVQIYLSKFIAATVIAIGFFVITFAVLLTVTTLFQLKNGTMSMYDITEFIKKAVCAIPLWIAGIGFGMMFLFIFNKKRSAYLAYFLLVVILERIVMLLAAEPVKLGLFVQIRKIIVTQHFSLIPYPADPARNIPFTIALGLIYAFVSTLIGIIVYKRRK